MSEDFARAKTGSADMEAERVRSLTEGFESDRTKLLELLQKEERQKTELETQLAQREAAWSQKSQQIFSEAMAQFEKEKAGISQAHQRRLESELAGLESEKKFLLDRQGALAEELKNEKAGRQETLASLEKRHADAFEASAKSHQQQMEEQKALYDRRLREAQAQHAEDRAEMEKTIAELGERTTRLQEALDRKVVATSSDLAGHMEEMRKAFEAQKAALEKRTQELESRYEEERLGRAEAQSQAQALGKHAEHLEKLQSEAQARLAEQEERFAASRAELLAACEAFYSEVMERELAVERREKAFPKGQ
jgi:hypothetical protein